MTELLVSGLGDAGPGDIVGAFVNEADVLPAAIGEIEIDGDRATVEVADGVADRVVETMDGGRVGHSEVAVGPLDETARAVGEYADEQRALVELEREAEMERHETEIRRLAGREREAKGRALLDLRGRDEGESLSGYLVRFVRDEPLGDTEIGVGDLVMVSKRDPLRDDNPTGTVTELTAHSVTVASGSKPPGFVFSGGCRLDLYVNDVVYQRMLDAVDRLAAGDPNADLRDVVAGASEPAAPEPVPVQRWHDDALNEDQRAAVAAALGADPVHLIHGPPGTGKTTTAVEVIRQAVARGESVLATAPSNTAVDTLVEKLVAAGLDVVRVGHPARVTDTLTEHTLDAAVADHPKHERAKQLREAAFDLLDEQDDLTAPSGRWRRGLSEDRIRDLADEGRGARGVPGERIAEMAEWLDLQAEIDDRFERADALREAAVDETLAAADVVCTTNATAGSDALADRAFDLLVLDEATQATEPSCLIPLVRADRAVLVGDHRQLPPTVQSEAAARRGLDETLFERLAAHDDVRSLLGTQYRMHETIMDAASETFYDGALRAADGVGEHTLAGLGVAAEDLPPAHRPILAPDAPLVVADTDGTAPERQREGSTSRENPTEAALVAGLADSVVAAGVPVDEVAVISPYDDQVDRLADRVPAGVEVDTVDGFQGREKAVVLVSLVRSNERGEVGFLREARRFNVALTRARRKAVIVGDGTTVRAEPAIDAVFEYARERGRYVDAPTPNAA